MLLKLIEPPNVKFERVNLAEGSDFIVASPFIIRSSERARSLKAMGSDIVGECQLVALADIKQLEKIVSALLRQETRAEVAADGRGGPNRERESVSTPNKCS